MKKSCKLIVVLLVVGLIFSFAGCEEADDEDNVSFQSFSPRSISVDNMTKQRLVAFKGSLHRDFLIGGIPADVRSHGLERKSSLFRQTGDFALVLITETEYKRNKTNLEAAPVFAELYAFYNNEGDNQNSFQISSRVGGAGRITLNNPTNWNIEIRRNSTSGEILGYVASQTVGTTLRLEIPDDYDLYPIFKRFHNTDKEIYSVTPIFKTASAGLEHLIGTPYMEPFSLTNGNPQRWDFGQLAQTLNFSISSGGIYIRVENDSRVAVRFTMGNEDQLTSLGVRGIQPGYTNLYNIKVLKNPDGSYPESQTISGYSIGSSLGNIPLPERVYKTDYLYTLRVTGTNVTTFAISEISESTEPMDLEAKFGFF